VPLHIAERADVIVDFTGLAPGTVRYLVNAQGDPGTTGEVLQFQVVAATSADTSTPPAGLNLDPFFHPRAADVVRRCLSTMAVVSAPANCSAPLQPITRRYRFSGITPKRESAVQ
jgi:bilirubin oxidase